VFGQNAVMKFILLTCTPWRSWQIWCYECLLTAIHVP